MAGVRTVPIPRRIDVDANGIDQRKQTLRSAIREPEVAPLRSADWSLREVGLRFPQILRDEIDHLRIFVADQHARDVAARHRRLDESIVITLGPVRMAVEQKETEQQS